MSSRCTSFRSRFLIFIFLHLTHGSTLSIQNDPSNKELNIGAILDVDSRIGREAKTAMEIAVKHLNNRSHNLVIHFRNSSRNRDPLQTAYEADELIKDMKIQVLVTMETWQETILVSLLGKRKQLIPLLSLATSPPLTSPPWPFLVRMANNESFQMRCIADIIQFYQWRRVITISEDNNYGSTTLLYEALQGVGSEIEYQLSLPPFSSLSNPKSAIHDRLEKLKSKQSRVFIVLQSSLPLATYLFEEAKQMGLMDKDSVWITTETITSLLDSVNSSVISSMQGVIGMKTYFSNTTSSFRDFYTKFRIQFGSEYPDEDYLGPGIYALQAYDAISTIIQAMENLLIPKNSSITSKTLLESILSTNFRGLGGKIRFKDGELSEVPAYHIVNVVGKRYRELGFWLPEFGFSKCVSVKEGGQSCSERMEGLDGVVYWPGGLLGRTSRGWEIPTKEKPMRIAVPAGTSFQIFVRKTGQGFDGFSIKVFEAAVDVLKTAYDLNYMFEEVNGSYDSLIDHVFYKDYDAVVGDVIILPNRSIYVDFTMPYLESGLSMMVPVKRESRKALMFVKPFTMKMWIVTGVISCYTVFIVWFLEHRSNPEFQGSWHNQLGTALWFTFSTFFFAHREKLSNNLTRLVTIVWLLVVLILTISYTASLTSMLTAQRLDPKVTDILSLQRNNSTVGYGDSFVGKYLVDVLRFKPENIKLIPDDKYHDNFVSGNIKAAFFEVHYAKVFLTKHCKKYIVIEPSFISGGFGFVFPKGSPIQIDISNAILKILLNGRINELREKYLYNYSSECLNPRTNIDNDNLSLESFWVLFLFSFGTSTFTLLFFLIQLVRKIKGQQEAYEENISFAVDINLQNQDVRLAQYFHNPELQLSTQVGDLRDMSSSNWENMCVYNTSNHSQASILSEVEMSGTSE